MSDELQEIRNRALLAIKTTVDLQIVEDLNTVIGMCDNYRSQLTAANERIAELEGALKLFEDPEMFAADSGFGCACSYHELDEKWTYCKAHERLLAALAAKEKGK